MRSKAAIVNKIVEKSKVTVACMVYSLGAGGKQSFVSCIEKPRAKCVTEVEGIVTRMQSGVSCEEAERSRKAKESKGKRGAPSCECVAVQAGPTAPEVTID